MEKKHRTAVAMPDTVLEQMKDIGNKTGKTFNSLVIDSCIEYIRDFKSKYDFLFKESKN